MVLNCGSGYTMELYISVKCKQILLMRLQLLLRRRLNCYIVAATTVTDCNLELHFDRKEERVIYKDTLSSTQRGGQNREGLNKTQSGQYFIKTVHRT